MAIARLTSVVLDCPDAEALARFYAAVIDGELVVDDGWVDVRAEGQCLSFQSVEDYRPPVWPGQDVPQQAHLDFLVDDLDEGEAAVLALGARRADHQPGTTFRVFLDPVGHPFCLCLN